MNKVDWYKELKIPKEVVVLGATYQITITERDLAEMADHGEEVAGTCSVYSNIIEIYSDDFEEYVTEMEIREQMAKAHHTLRHELIHALFIQSGLDYTYGDDECLVDFLAVQIPKIKEHF